MALFWQFPVSLNRHRRNVPVDGRKTPMVSGRVGLVVGVKVGVLGGVLLGVGVIVGVAVLDGVKVLVLLGVGVKVGVLVGAGVSVLVPVGVGHRVILLVWLPCSTPFTKICSVSALVSDGLSKTKSLCSGTRTTPAIFCDEFISVQVSVTG